MTRAGRLLRIALPALTLIGLVSLAPSESRAITYGQQDCTDPDNNIGCKFRNTVSLSGFRLPTAADNTTEEFVSFLRCSGSLLSNDPYRMVILTAGHCASAYLDGLQNHTIEFVGVSFDAVIDRDVSEASGLWSADQYIKNGQPVLSRDYGPQGAKASNIQFDYAVIVFEKPFVLGEDVDLALGPDGVEPVVLPEEDFLVGLVGGGKKIPLTAVGYGTGEAHNKPGEGGNAGGAVNSIEEFGQRWYTELTEAFSFMGPEKNLLLGSQNPARGNEGTCGGDSGGPLFYDDGLDVLQVGITSSGDAICRATSIIARTDGARAVEFLQCVQDEVLVNDRDGILACGCIEVDSQGECPDE